ncbi:MAG: glycerophosphodiester phosphodiesterase family protein [Bacteriovoracaceae bacterium]
MLKFRHFLLFVLIPFNVFAFTNSIEHLWVNLFEKTLMDTIHPEEIEKPQTTELIRSIASEADPYRPLLIAHRGVLYPDRIENTTDAIIEAMKHKNVDGIEIDVCITLDDQIILWHDNNPFDLLGYVRRFGIEGRKVIPAIFDSDLIGKKSINLLTYEQVKSSLGYIDSTYNKNEMFYQYPKINVEIPLFKDVISETFFQREYPFGNGKAIFLDTKLPADLSYSKKFALSLVKVLRSVANAEAIKKNIIIL